MKRTKKIVKKKAKIGKTLRIRLPKNFIVKDNPWKVSENQVGDKIATYTPAPVLTLCGQLEDSIMLLENRISNVIAKINSLM